MRHIEQILLKFEDYEKKIELLKSIENKLNQLDTTGFEREAEKIRMRLKSPKDAPELKKEFISLKDKIEKMREKERKRREKWEQENKEITIKEINRLINETEDLIKVSLSKAVSEKNPLWLASLKIISLEFKNAVQKYKSEEISLYQAKKVFEKFDEEVKTLSTPPSFGEGKKVHRQTYYEILGVSHNATQEEIKNSYRKLMQAFHVDKFTNSPDWTKEKLREMDEKINEAYKTLSDPKQRKKYDENPKKI